MGNSSDKSELLLPPANEIAARWAGGLLPPRFLTVCAVNAQICLNVTHNDHIRNLIKSRSFTFQVKLLLL